MSIKMRSRWREVQAVSRSCAESAHHRVTRDSAAQDRLSRHKECPYTREAEVRVRTVGTILRTLTPDLKGVPLKADMLTRRRFLAISAIAPALPRFTFAASNRYAALPDVIAAMEKKHSGQIGVSILDTATGERAAYRGDERFPMCSTFKVLLAAAVLHRVDTLKDDLRRQVDVPPKPLIGNSPLTGEHAGGSMTLGALCSAILTRSDNTAANVLLETIGGTSAITTYARSIGDGVTRLDRTETSLNESLAGDPRDTTSPDAMVHNLQSLLLGDALKPESRKQLTDWMQGSTTGLVRLRAKLPKDWCAADKTGSNGEHTTNDIAVLWPAGGRPPVIVAAYITQCPGPEAKRNAMLAEIGRLIAAGA
jgi:beta-lactamase class A